MYDGEEGRQVLLELLLWTDFNFEKLVFVYNFKKVNLP